MVRRMTAGALRRRMGERASADASLLVAEALGAVSLE